MNNLHEFWLVSGLSHFFSGLYFKKLFGNNEYKHLIYQDLKDVCTYEREQGHVVLDFNYAQACAMKETINKSQISARHHLMGNPQFLKIVEKKSHLVIRLIDDWLTREIFIQLVNKMFTNALNCVSISEFTPKCRNPLSISIESLIELLASFSSKDIKHLIELWVYKPGVARFNCSFSFNRKKNTVEIELKQDMVSQKGYRKYVGPISIVIQEIDGSFTHNLQIEDNLTSKFDILCHSKGKIKFYNFKKVHF